MKENNFKTIAHTLKPGVNTGINLTTAPNAICTFQHESRKDGQSMVLFADSDGFVNVFINPSAQSEHISRFTLEYIVNGAIMTQVIELRASDQPIINMPFPEVHLSRVISGSATRPALSHAEAMQLTNNELLQKGYPMRPDPVTAIGAFEMWYDAVSKPVTIVPPVSVAHPYHTAGPVVSTPQASNNWSGFELTATPGTYNWVTGSWIVPTIIPRANESDYSSAWIGIDDGSPYYPPSVGMPPVNPPAMQGDIVQGGTLHNCTGFSADGIVYNTFQYNVWTEVYPLQPTQMVIPGFNVKAGDKVHVQVWIGNEVSIYPDLNGGSCFFLFENLTTSQSVKIEKNIEGLQPVQGSAAEWIMESPLNTATPRSLAKYNTFEIDAAYAYNPLIGGFIPFLGAANYIYTMYGAPPPPPPVVPAPAISDVTAIGTYTMQFTWKGYN